MSKANNSSRQSPRKRGEAGESTIKKNNPLAAPKWAVSVVLVFAAVVFTRALFNGFASWNDDDYIVYNPFIRNFSFSGITDIFTSIYYSNYHPLTTLTYLFEYSLFGLNPLPYHLINVLLHLLNIFLVYKLVEKLSGKSFTALVVSVLFALHPVHTEPVAWISGRKDLLYAFFFLLSLLSYLKYTGSGFSRKHYLWTVLLFLASLLSKQMAVTLPVILIVIDVYKGRKINKNSLAEKIPFFILSLGFGVISLLPQMKADAINDLSGIYGYTGRFFLLAYSIAFYLIKLVAPFWLSVMHYYPEPGGSLLPGEYYLSLPFLIITVWLIVRKHSLRRESLFGALFFIITVSVILPFVSAGESVVSERCTYIPYIGLFYIAGQWISDISAGRLRNIALVILALFVLMFSYRSWERLKVWKNGKTLFTDVIKKNPRNYRPYLTRGDFLRNEGDLEGALKDYSRVLSFKPDFVQCLINRSDVKFRLGDTEGALTDISIAISSDTSNAEAYYNRGLQFYALGMNRDAFIDYSKALQYNPELVEAYNNRGVVYQEAGDTLAAMNDFNKAVAVNPEFVEAYNNRAALKEKQGDLRGAIDDFTCSIKLFPFDDRVFHLRGIARFNSGNHAAACEDWKTAAKMGNKKSSELAEKYCK